MHKVGVRRKLQIRKIKHGWVMTDDTENETDDVCSSQPCNGAWTVTGDKLDGNGVDR